MTIEDIKNNYYFENLTVEHDLSDFDSGDENLNDFLKNDALAQQKEKLNVTKLIMCNGNLIGYVPILTETLILKNINDEDLKLKIKGKLGIKSKNRNIPAVKIGRLAIDKKYSGKGLGTHIMGTILTNLKINSETEIGFRFILVEGYAKAFNFYVLYNGFEYLKKDHNNVQNIDFIAKIDPTKNSHYTLI